MFGIWLVIVVESHEFFLFAVLPGDVERAMCVYGTYQLYLVHLLQQAIQKFET